MFRALLLSVFGFFLAGCTNLKTVPWHYEISEENLFIPVNLDVSAGEYVNKSTAEVANFLSRSVTQSGQFSRTDRNSSRWPYTLKIDYEWEQVMTASDFPGTVVSVATLMIVPGYLDETHTIEVSVLRGDFVVADAEYVEEMRLPVSIRHDAIEHRKEAVNRLLEQMFKDFREKSLIPTLKDIEDDERESFIQFVYLPRAECCRVLVSTDRSG